MNATHQIASADASTAARGRGSSRFVGVSWSNHDRKWVAHINANGQQRNLGHFKDEIEAAKVYDEAARQAFGEWATPNFPTDAERAFASKWYSIDDACRFFNISRAGWKNWVRAGRITCGRVVPSSLGGGKRKVFTLEELQRLKEQMFGEDKLYKDGKTGMYHVPPELITRHQAWAMFGVEKVTWERWEREGWITCGTRLPSGPKVYPIAEIRRLVEEHGVLSPPYPDPQRPGVYRVPLGGHDITRREVIIDAESLPLIEGGSCHLAGTGEGAFVSLSTDGIHEPLRRIITGFAGTEMNIGHANGDPLDCRRENLVVRTPTQRTWTKRKSLTIGGRPPTSRYKGVGWHSQTKKWIARIYVAGRGHYLGVYQDEADAADAYDTAARKYFGEHAWLNFPGEGERGLPADDQPLAPRMAA
jgi:hypothetical protein